MLSESGAIVRHLTRRTCIDGISLEEKAKRSRSANVVFWWLNEIAPISVLILLMARSRHGWNE